MRILSVLIAVMAIVAVGSTSTFAKGHTGYKKHPDAYRYVYAESQYDPNKSIVAPVRHSRLGDQVLVPERGWTDCEFTCKYTLQKEYLDFWEALEDSVQPGYLFDLLGLNR